MGIMVPCIGNGSTGSDIAMAERCRRREDAASSCGPAARWRSGRQRPVLIPRVAGWASRPAGACGPP